MTEKKKWTVVDLFSGAGGMSYGFHLHPSFRIVGAVDAQKGKPSSGDGSLQCNLTYQSNIGIEPLDCDLGVIDPDALRCVLGIKPGELNILISCAPCTGFSRTLAKNHILDDPRNSLVRRSSLFVEAMRPDIFLMENARELIAGNFGHHFEGLRGDLIRLGYSVHCRTHFLSKFGLPQQRERALVIAVKKKLILRTLEDLWDGYRVNAKAINVRRAIGDHQPIEGGVKNPDDPLHIAPSFSDPRSRRRLQLIPHNGGSWSDLAKHSEAEDILTPAMLRYIARGEFGSHPDVYGRMWWDRPAVTIKRECAHIGNGRYSHPEQDRLCTVREMSILQGFPRNYKFVASGLSNMYRHIGDAVPPLISYQFAKVCEWILGRKKPDIRSAVLQNTNLLPEDIEIEPNHQYVIELPATTPRAERFSSSRTHASRIARSASRI